MNNSIDHKMTAQETLHIIDLGGYVLNEQRVHLKLSEEEMQEAIVFSPKRITEIKEEIGESWKKASDQRFCRVQVVNMDCFEAAHTFSKGFERKTLVMNFANAIYCGGGFLEGADAQEEALCRASSLYASISSEDAKKMYEYNFMYKNPFDSDYMVVSPNVEVFRDATGELIESFLTAVVTIPALNLKGRASKLESYKVHEVMKNRIHNMFAVAFYLGYTNLVLGAWGCGAFGHDAKQVAQYFKEVLEQNQKWKMFSQITFAVMDKSRDQYNYNSFVKFFGKNFVYGNLEEASKCGNFKEIKTIESNDVKRCVITEYLPPIVDPHRDRVQKGKDLKFMSGILKNKYPFLSEVYYCEELETIELIVVLSAKGFRMDTIAKVMDDRMTAERNQAPIRQAAILTDLQVSNLDAVSDSKASEELCDLLIEQGLIQVHDDGFVFDNYISYDLAGEKVVVCIVTLQEGSRQFCEVEMN